MVRLPALWDTPVMKVGSRKIPTVRGAEAGVSISPEEPPDPPPLVPGGAWTVTPSCSHSFPSRLSNPRTSGFMCNASGGHFCSSQRNQCGCRLPATSPPHSGPSSCSSALLRPPSPPLPGATPPTHSPLQLHMSHLWTARLSGVSRAVLVPWVMCTADSRGRGAFQCLLLSETGNLYSKALK